LLSWIDFGNFADNTHYLITANLPYIKDNDYSHMDKEVILHEPSIALYWWKKTWFEMYEYLIESVFILLSKYSLASFTVFIEIGFDQWDVAKKFLLQHNLDYNVYLDNSWIERCIKITLKK
jgi:methylase of polypeptide subunit release factors